MTQIFKYYESNNFKTYEVVSLKGEKKFYVEGYASTTDIDKSGEVVNYEAQRDILRQILNETITLDIEHEEWFDDEGNLLEKPKNTKIPVGKVIQAELRERGVWVKVEINPHILTFKSVWNSIKDGFLRAFSIAYYPIEKIKNEISKLNLVNITLTGSPVNPNATFSVSMKSAKAFLDKKDKEVSEMGDETKPSVKAEEEQTKLEENVNVETEKQPEVEKEPEQEVEKEVEKEPEQEVKEPEVKSEPQNTEEIETLRAEIKALREEQAKLKAELEKPVLKSIKEEPKKVEQEELKFVSPLKLI